MVCWIVLSSSNNRRQATGSATTDDGKWKYQRRCRAGKVVIHSGASDSSRPAEQSTRQTPVYQEPSMTRPRSAQAGRQAWWCNRTTSSMSAGVRRVCDESVWWVRALCSQHSAAHRHTETETDGRRNKDTSRQTSTSAARPPAEIGNDNV